MTVADRRLPDKRLVWSPTRRKTHRRCNLCGTEHRTQHLARHERTQGHQRLLAALAAQAERRSR